MGLLTEIDVLSIFGDRFVLSHILMPEDMDRYVEIFNSRGLDYRFFLLKPDYKTALERCHTRTCHTSITPEEWVRHFYDALVFDGSVEVVENTDMTAGQTANYVLGRCEW